MSGWSISAYAPGDASLRCHHARAPGRRRPGSSPREEVADRTASDTASACERDGFWPPHPLDGGGRARLLVLDRRRRDPLGARTTRARRRRRRAVSPATVAPTRRMARPDARRGGRAARLVEARADAREGRSVCSTRRANARNPRTSCSMARRARCWPPFHLSSRRGTGAGASSGGRAPTRCWSSSARPGVRVPPLDPVPPRPAHPEHRRRARLRLERASLLRGGTARRERLAELQAAARGPPRRSPPRGTASSTGQLPPTRTGRRTSRSASSGATARRGWSRASRRCPAARRPTSFSPRRASSSGEAGPLRKGAGLCHGTAGNGCAFLALHARTGDERWLDVPARSRCTRSSRSSAPSSRATRSGPATSASRSTSGPASTAGTACRCSTFSRRAPARPPALHRLRGMRRSAT